MNSFNETKAVHQSLDAFEGLRDGLGYLRSISVCFEWDEESHSRLSALMVEWATSGDSIFNSDYANELSRSYFLMIKALLVSLMFAAIEHYQDLVKSNSELKHVELEATVDRMSESGLLDVMRRLRNAVFHIKPNEDIDSLVEEVHVICVENHIVTREVEDLLYEATEQVFRGTEIYRQPREVLEQDFQAALAYYRENLANES